MTNEKQAGQAQEVAADTQATNSEIDAATNGTDTGSSAPQDGQDTDQPADSQQDTDQPEENRISRLNAENAKWRRLLREQEKANKEQQAEMDAFKHAMLKALGVDEKGETSPEELIKQAEARASDMESRYTRLSQKLALNEAVAAAKADPDLTIPFIKGSEEFHALNPADDDYPAQVAALVSETVEAVPKLRAASIAPSSGNSATSVGTKAESGKITMEDLEKMTPQEIFEAQQKGQLKHLYEK